ncbi:hypothetical protein HY450_04080 [Candidatus Pacearchaeota archaeon]|nr:hypothetical protein [Candidatus Pacearchaeota archaeon]
MSQFFGMSLGMSQRMEQRLEQALTLSQIQSFETEGGVDAEEQYKRLQAIVRDLEKGVYSDTENFQERIMKRIKKNDRTIGIKDMVSELRGIIEQSKPSLKDVRRIVELGIKAYEKANTPPSLEFEQARQIMERSPFQAEQKSRVIEIGLKNYENGGATNNLYPFILEISSDARTNSLEVFTHTFNRLEEIVVNSNSWVSYLRNNLMDTLPNQVDPKTLDLGLEGLVQHQQINANLQDINPSQEIRRLLGTPDVAHLIRDYSIPIPIMAFLQTQLDNPETMQKISGFCKDKHFSESKDTQRAIQRGFAVLDKHREGKEIVAHTTKILESSRQLARIFSYMGLLTHSGNFEYDFNANNFTELEKRLKNKVSERAFCVLNLSEGHRERLIETAHKINPKLIDIISTLSGVYGAFYQDELPILTTITEAMIDDRFNEWRYSHALANEQLSVLDGHFESWIKNRTGTRILGDTSGIEPMLEAVRQLGQEAKALYQEKYQKAAGRKTLEDLEQQIFAIEKELRDSKSPEEKRTLGLQARELRKEYSTLKQLELFEDISLSNWQINKKLLEGCAKDAKDAETKNVYEQASTILSGEKLARLRKVTISETDGLLDLFETGRIPVQSCQRWTERTGYNDCLLAYVGEANKKLIQVKDSNYNVIARSILRLLPIHGKTPLLFVERPYSTSWSQDNARAVITHLFEKACEMSEEIGREVAVGVVDSSYVSALKKMVKGEADVKIARKICLPRSINPAEYSDGLGGRLKSGSSVTTQELRYVLVEG